MVSEVRMPQLGESVTEGTVVRWLKQPGDHVAQDESLAEVETEKVNVEIPSPFEGTLTQLMVPEGETVEVGVVIATIEAVGGTATPVSAQPTRIGAAAGASTSPSHVHAANAVIALPGAAPLTATAASPRRSSAPSFTVAGSLGPANPAHGMFSTGETGGASASSGPPAPVQNPPRTGPEAGAVNGAGASDGAGRFSPAVLRLAGEYNVDLSRLSGSGAGGRITRKDVQAFIGVGGTAPPAPVAVVPGKLAEEGQLVATPPPTEAPAPAAAAEPGADEELEPLTSTRRAIAAHMVRSVQTSPHAWMMVEVDVSPLVAFRAAVKDGFKAREGADLTYLPFMIKATVAALKENPRLNSSWSVQGVILKRRIHIGIAVDTPQGLVVPVIHDADGYSIAGLARRSADLAARARARRLKLEDVQGGTFTIDNVGPIGSVVSQPIINQPQCAIVTMESIVKRPVVLNDAIAIRSIMNCCISFDHRIVDGGDIGPFMKALKAHLEAMGAETPLF